MIDHQQRPDQLWSLPYESAKERRAPNLIRTLLHAVPLDSRCGATITLLQLTALQYVSLHHDSSSSENDT
jgi:hypothetical protein